MKFTGVFTFLVFLLATIPALATDITIAGETVEWAGPSANVEVRFFLSAQLVTPENQRYAASSPANGTTTFKWDCTVSGSVITVPEITLPATTNAVGGGRVRWTWVFWNKALNRAIVTRGGFEYFQLPHVPTTTTWTAIKAYNDSAATGDTSSSSNTYTKTQVDTKFSGKANLAGDTFTGPVFLPTAAPTVASQATTKAYVDSQDAGKANKSGDTFTGPVYLPATAPTAPTQAVTKAYVDALPGATPFVYSRSATAPAVPFDAPFVDLGDVSPNVIFTVNSLNAAGGRTALARIVGDGVHSPVFTGFKKANSSANFVTTNNVLNIVQFLYDGANYWYTIWQEMGVSGGGGGTGAPALTSAVIGVVDANKVILTYSVPLDTASVPATSAFSVSGGRSVSAVNISGSTVTLTVTPAYASGASVFVTYMPGSVPIQDTSGNDAAALANQVVTNNAGALVAAAYGTSAGFTLSGTTYTASATPAIAVADYSPNSGTDFAYQTRYVASDASGGLLGLSATGGNIPYTSQLYYAWTASGVLYHSPGAVSTGITMGAGDYFRLSRVSGVIKLQTSTDGVNWTDRYTYTTADNQKLYLHLQQIVSGNKVYNPAVIGCNSCTDTGSGGDTTPPTLATAKIGVVELNKIRLTYDEVLDSVSVPATSAFTVPGKTVTAVAITGSRVVLTVNADFAPSDVVTVSYTPGGTPIQDTSGNDAAAFSAQAVTNGAGTLIDLTLDVVTNLTQSGTTYTGTGSPATATGTRKTVLDGDFAVQMKWQTDADASVLGLKTTDAASTYSGFIYYTWTASNLLYTGISGAATASTYTASAGDYFRIVRIDNVIKVQRSATGLSPDWVDVRILASNDGQVLYFNLDQIVGTGRKFYEPKVIGTVAK